MDLAHMLQGTRQLLPPPGFRGLRDQAGAVAPEFYKGDRVKDVQAGISDFIAKPVHIKENWQKCLLDGYQ